MRRELAAVLVALNLLGAPALGEEAVDRLFAPGALVGVAAGTVLDFERVRTVPEGAAVDPIEGATVEIAVADGAATVRFDQDGRPQSFDQPLAAAHPVLLLFLETSHKSIAELAGGSPFYVKNRIVESFQKAEVEEVETPSGSGQRIVLHPFANDKNLDRMGDFANLEMTFTLTDGVPGGLYAAEARAGPYTESMTLKGDRG